jgi:hypothetical protein
MSHFAELDADNKVIRVLVGDNNDPAGDEGYQWLLDNLGGIWVKTSFNAKIRKNFAGIGFTYDEARDAFIPPKVNCHEEESLDESLCRWVCSNLDHDLSERDLEYVNQATIK